MFIDPKTMRFSTALSGAVIIKGFLLYGGFRLGSWVDAQWGTSPFLMVGCLTVGAGLGIWWILYIAEKYKP